MAANFSGLIETLVSLFVDIGGNGAKSGGKGLLLAGARKIGWASGGGGSTRGGRFSGHSLSGHRMGSGSGGARRNLTNYNPKNDYQQRASEHYNRGTRSGSGRHNSPYTSGQAPSLHGRSGFEDAGPLGRGNANRWIRNRNGRAGSYTPRPRSFIKF